MAWASVRRSSSLAPWSFVVVALMVLGAGSAEADHLVVSPMERPDVAVPRGVEGEVFGLLGESFPADLGVDLDDLATGEELRTSPFPSADERLGGVSPSFEGAMGRVSLDLDFFLGGPEFRDGKIGNLGLKSLDNTGELAEGADFSELAIFLSGLLVLGIVIGWWLRRVRQPRRLSRQPLVLVR